MLATLIPFFGVKKPVTCGALPFPHLFIYFNQSPAEQQELGWGGGGVSEDYVFLRDPRIASGHSLEADGRD